MCISLYVLSNNAGLWPLDALILTVKMYLVLPGDGALEDIQENPGIILITKIPDRNQKATSKTRSSWAAAQLIFVARLKIALRSECVYPCLATVGVCNTRASNVQKFPVMNLGYD